MKGTGKIVKISENTFKLYGIIGTYKEGDIDKYIETVCTKVESALEGGMTILQLREKHMFMSDKIKLARAVKEICNIYGVPLIINDSIEVCVLSEADGVHLGQSDGSIREARKVLGKDKIIGGTAHNLYEAIQAEKEGASYLGSGAAFGSETKSDAVKIDLDEYNVITRTVKIPVVAIGGINYENIDLLSDRGLSGIAVISAIFNGEDIKHNTSLLKEKLKNW